MTTLAVDVLKENGREEQHFCVVDGVNIGERGELVLVSERNEFGRMIEGQIYAPGQWTYVNIYEADDNV